MNKIGENKMNDRFKFRVWDKELREYSIAPNYINCETGELEQLNLPEGLSPGGERFIVEQCTGLKDINGKLIYEGEIVCIVEYSDYERRNAIEKRQAVEIINSLKVPSYNEPAFINKNHSQVIIWDNKRATFMMKDRINSTGRPESLCNKRYVVIGNIHENPYLLKGED